MVRACFLIALAALFVIHMWKLRSTNEWAEVPDGVALHHRGVVTPYDPVEAGACSITLRLVSPTGEGVSSRARLWRLNAPANEVWSEGDQCQWAGQIPQQGERIDGLAVGVYRAECSRTARDRVDPPSFRVDAGTEEVVLTVAVPARREVYVAIVDQNGEALLEILRPKREHPMLSRDEPTVPGWVVPRRLLDPEREAGFKGPRYGGKYGGSRDSAATLIAEDARGFRVGRYSEATRTSYRIHRWRAVPGGRNDVLLEVDNRDARPWEFVGVAIPRQTTLDAIRGSNGEVVADLEEHVAIESNAIRRSAATGNEWWREIPIHVMVDHPDYAELRFGYRLLEGPPTIRTLSPRG